ncbi:G protein pathway suppressor 2 isoform X2 [Sitodiplosis mosellana]|uniref:G protein pathway suppressor 2 isoform X2 n=1 Tax=Sitodiplosis mosellana TaxID=263140 RepID=UPI002443DFC3|nr:G protein pathway suppressor 2 isoform X2 [Sitodiplosis mosellana]
MPAATEQPAAKKEREELLWQSLKEHVMRERQKIKEEQEAEVEEERLRKEREERDRQDAMTLGETKEQIQILNTRLKELRNEKQQLFLRLKKVLNEDENRKKQQQQKDSEMFALQSIVQQQGSHQQIFLPPRAPQLMQKYLQSGPPPMSATPPNKRGRSPSPTPQYYKTNNPPYPPSQKHEDGRRGGEIARTVLWNKPTYQNPPGTLYYPSNSQDSRQSIVYPAYAPNMNIPMISSYHPELTQQQAQSQALSSEQVQSQAQHQSQSNQQPTSQSSNTSHDKGKPLQSVSQHSQHSQSQKIQQQSSHGGPPPPHKPHAQQISLEKLNERGYHLEKQQPPPVQQSTHISENMYRMPMSLSSGMLTISPQNQQQIQNMKPSGSITQGYMTTNNTINRAPPSASHQQPPQSQPASMPPMHYQRHRY